jgi:UDP-N-acetylmuramoyl-tripeptide--D-alanyl-D-alanine ligase
LDDSYNANPSSLAAALDVLTSAPGEHWLVLGDMAELGDNEEVLHQQAGESARRAGVTRLFAVGALSRATVGAFGEGASHFESHAALIGAVIKALDTRAPGGISVLVKGSRSARMEKVVEALVTDVGCCPPGAEQGYAA